MSTEPGLTAVPAQNSVQMMPAGSWLRREVGMPRESKVGKK